MSRIGGDARRSGSSSIERKPWLAGEVDAELPRAARGSGPAGSHMDIINRLLAADVDVNAELNMHRPSRGGNSGRFADRQLGTGCTALYRATEAGDMAWVRETFAAMQPFMGSGSYVNYLGDEEDGDRVAAAYGSNFSRLQQVKAQYDPTNFFHVNQNIRPLQ